MTTANLLVRVEARRRSLKAFATHVAHVAVVVVLVGASDVASAQTQSAETAGAADQTTSAAGPIPLTVYVHG